MTRILFLDVDGVLNHAALVHDADAGPFPLCRKALSRLFDILRRTGARIVLSSSWRKIEELVEILVEHGVMDHAHEDWRTKALGHDPSLPDGAGQLLRGREIAEWLSRHPEVVDYAIVDDDSDFLPEQTSRFVRTGWAVGLTDDHVDEVSGILTGDAPSVQRDGPADGPSTPSETSSDASTPAWLSSRQSTASMSSTA